jgi:DNA polymerase III subunit epsilon
MERMNGGSKPLAETPYVAIDVETTGLEPGDGHRVCEIALLRFLRGTVVDSIVSLVNPLRPISPGATAVNGITDAMVAPAPCFPDLFPGILEFLGDDTTVFHNAPFDLSFLRREARLAGGRWPRNPVIDTLVLARRTRRFRSHSLSALCGTLGIGSGFHRAAADAYAAGKLLLLLAPEEIPGR